jgi:hypothetical protein
VIFNPIRYRSRWKLYEDFKRMVEKSGAILYTAEVAFGERKFVITEPNNAYHLQLRTTNELWLKENIINLLIQRLPLDWKYVAWIDADVTFTRGDWANETLHQLQHYDIVQMWSQAHDLSPNYEIVKTFRSFVWCWQNGIKPNISGGDYYNAGTEGIYHPGFAWSCTKTAFNNLGGLIDWAILGGADLYMARALTKISKTLPQSLGKSGKNWLKLWTDRADKYINGNVGVVDGLLLHSWHGFKNNRLYKDRGQILINTKFEPTVDLKRDNYGLWQLTDLKPQLRDGLKQYFRLRNEDAI